MPLHFPFYFYFLALRLRHSSVFTVFPHLGPHPWSSLIKGPNKSSEIPSCQLFALRAALCIFYPKMYLSKKCRFSECCLVRTAGILATLLSRYWKWWDPQLDWTALSWVFCEAPCFGLYYTKRTNPPLPAEALGDSSQATKWTLFLKNNIYPQNYFSDHKSNNSWLL